MKGTWTGNPSVDGWEECTMHDHTKSLMHILTPFGTVIECIKLENHNKYKFGKFGKSSLNHHKSINEPSIPCLPGLAFLAPAWACVARSPLELCLQVSTRFAWGEFITVYVHLGVVVFKNLGLAVFSLNFTDHLAKVDADDIWPVRVLSWLLDYVQYQIYWRPKKNNRDTKQPSPTNICRGLPSQPSKQSSRHSFHGKSSWEISKSSKIMCFTHHLKDCKFATLVRVTRWDRQRDSFLPNKNSTAHIFWNQMIRMGYQSRARGYDPNFLCHSLGLGGMKQSQRPCGSSQRATTE